MSYQPPGQYDRYPPQGPGMQRGWPGYGRRPRCGAETRRSSLIGHGDVFTPDGAMPGVVSDHGLAAIAGHLIVRALRRR